MTPDTATVSTSSTLLTVDLGTGRGPVPAFGYPHIDSIHSSISFNRKLCVSLDNHTKDHMQKHLHINADFVRTCT